MTIRKKLLSLFIEVEPDKEETPVQLTEKVVQNPISAIPVNTNNGKTDTAIAENLAGVLEAANMSGYDYFEFAKAIDALVTQIPSEQIRFQTVFTTAAVMGITKQKLIESTEHYMNVLKSEADKFSEMVAEQIKSNVTIKEESLAEIDKTIQDKAALIQQLTNEINTLTTDRATVANMVSESKIKIEQVQNDFAATLQIFVNKIAKDKEKINTYIGG